MKVSFSVVEGEIENFVDNLEIHEYILNGIYFSGKNKDKPWRRKVVLKYLDLSEIEIFDFIKKQKYRCILKFDKYNQAFPGENLLHLEIYNSYIE